MTDLLDSSQIRQIGVTIFSAILAFATPTEGFVLALVIAFGFNIFCGMRADGVSVVRCKNFSASKFKNALLEMLLYTVIVYVMYGIMVSCNDNTEALFVIKMLTYIFCYVYICNSFKNLIKAYPKNVAFRVIYYVLRFEFAKALPSYWKPIIDRLNNEFDKKEEENKNGSTN